MARFCILMMRPFVLLRSIIAVSLLGCSVPTAGPHTSEVIEQAKHNGGQFAFVEIDPHVVTALSTETVENARVRLADYGKPRASTIEVGDVLSVSIWPPLTGSAALQGGAPLGATGGGGVPSPGLPDQMVGTDGSISIPYAGRVPAAGRTPFQVQQTIESRLAEKLVEPQVVVNLVKGDSNSATVSGEDMVGARVPLPLRGARLLDVIAAAGGTKSPLYDTHVRLTRGEATLTVPMEEIVSDPSENVYVWPGDIITLFRAPQTFSVFGATFTNQQVPFGAETISLAQAIAKAGGLQDARSDPEGVFLFRFESLKVVNALGVPPLAAKPDSLSPVVYHLDLRQAAGYFFAEQIALRDDDLIYVANAPMADLQKFFNLVGTISSPIISGAIIAKPR
jgi:polysaccharide biosynthesis/export protein